MSRTTCTICGSNECCCGSASVCSSYQAIPCAQSLPCSACPEDHTKTLINQTYAASLRIQDTWNIPDCGASAVVVIPGLSQITVGSYLWNPNYGYFKVTAFNSTLNTVTLFNTCIDGNSAPGTKVPACSDFNLSPPPCSCSNAQPDVFPYLALDFTAPNNGDCTNITVTTVNGLIAGKEVEISTGTYTLDSIVSGSVIKICNNGDGAIPGTSVIALDGAGNYQYPVILVDANPCTNPSEVEGKVIACNSSDTQVPLKSLIPGGDAPGLLVGVCLKDGSTTNTKFTPIDANERTCTTLAAGLTITNGDPTYTIQVTDNVFSVNDVLNIEGRTELFTVTAVGAGTIDVTAVPTPGANGTVALGKWICVQPCCASILTDLETIIDDQCIPTVYQVVYARQIFSQPITLGVDGTYEVVLSTDLGAFTLPGNTGCSWLASFDSLIVGLLDYTGLTGSMLMAEVELAMVSAGDTENGRLVWTAYNTDGWDIGGVVPGTANSIQKVIAPPNPNYPMMFNGSSVQSYVLAVGGAVIHPKLIFRCAVGENFAPTTVDSVKVMISGNIKAWRF